MKFKKSQTTMYLMFLIAATLIILITAVFAPLGSLLSSQFYAAGEDILSQANDSINNITDAAVKAEIQSMIGEARNAQENNIEVTTSMFKYSWIFVIALAGIIVFLFTRRMVEYTGGGFV